MCDYVSFVCWTCNNIPLLDIYKIINIGLHLSFKGLMLVLVALENFYGNHVSDNISQRYPCPLNAIPQSLNL